MMASRAFFWAYGWVWGRWWHRFTWRMSWSARWADWQRRLWPATGALVDYPARYFLVRAMRAGQSDCPHCGYDGFTDQENLFVCQSSGRNSTPDGISYWFEGLQTCARCGTTHSYGDST